MSTTMTANIISPGETLPQMPKPTHNETGTRGLKPYNTVNRAISKLQTCPRSDPDYRLYAPANRRAPYDGNKPTGTITTQGADGKGVPSGLRPFTVRELAALQGFPPKHVFAGPVTQQIKQIGNAVPPIVAKVLFSHIIKELTRADGVVEPDHIIID
jgi:DNA (cytosine-5)-methyltransferase 1